MCKVYTDLGGIKKFYHVCPPGRKIIHSLKLVDYLHVQADNPLYNYYVATHSHSGPLPSLLKYDMVLHKGHMSYIGLNRASI